MGPIEEALREKLFPALFGGEDINSKFRKILCHCVKHGGLSISEPRRSAESAYKTSKEDSGELVYSLLGGSSLNYIVHRACISGESAGARIESKHMKLVELDILKDLEGGQ